MLNSLLGNHPSYAYIFPELMLFAAGMLMLAVDLVLKEKNKGLVMLLGLASLAAVFAYMRCPVAFDPDKVTPLLKSMVVNDNYAKLFKYIFIIGAGIVFLTAVSYKPLTKYKGEFYALVMLCVPAMMLISASVNLLMIYLCIEYIGICCYVLAAYQKDDPKSSEGAIKYLILGAMAAAFLVYGIGLLYGLTGSLDINVMSQSIGAMAEGKRRIILIAFTFVIVGFGFKVAMAPFHFWAPDAYEGAPTPVTAFFSVLPKAAGLAAMVRVLLIMFSGAGVDWLRIIEVLAILTMTVGNVVAIWQTNIKRMLAYSGIAHVGYILIGLVAAGVAGSNTLLGREGIFSVLIYLVVYLFMNLGAFAVVVVVSNSLKSDNIEKYAGLGKRNIFQAVALTFFMLALAGIPPTAGFVGKFYIFKAAIENKLYLLAFIGIANSVISVYYYWNVVRLMFIKEPSDDSRVKAALPLSLAVLFTLIVVFVFGIFFQQLSNFVWGAALV